VGSSPTPGTIYAFDMTTSSVGLFPGQGALRAGAGAPWQRCPAWNIVTTIADVTGLPLADYLTTFDDEAVQRTDIAQIATFALSLVSWEDAGAPPVSVFIGHSLGEYSALVAAGILSVADGALLVAQRGAAMAQAAREQPGGMTALMGAGPEAIALTEQVAGLWIANINGEAQTVVAGTTEALSWLQEHYRELGWRRATPLAVGGAFHSPLMQPAAISLSAALHATTFQEGHIRVVANVDGVAYAGGDHWRDLLLRQLTAPVQFLRGIAALPEGITTSIEAAPAGVLTGLVKRIRPFPTMTMLEKEAAP
jgi:[acyl-carrier-protein] S-malonyltransferase